MKALVLALALLISSIGSAAAELSVGDPAPDFSLAGSDGKTYTLAGLLKEHDGVVLAFFPKAFTPG
jgi:peroxiredoxin Q/BCP